jgi:hypothetical protein
VQLAAASEAGLKFDFGPLDEAAVIERLGGR